MSAATKSMEGALSPPPLGYVPLLYHNYKKFKKKIVKCLSCAILIIKKNNFEVLLWFDNKNSECIA